jgi:hypothetical protein
VDELARKPLGLRHKITREVRRQLDHLDSIALEGDWVDAWADRECIDTDEAAIIAGTSRQTIRRRAADAATAGKPIGILLAKSVWLISLQRLLFWLEQNEGLPARVAAERRAEKLLADRAAPKPGLAERGATV